MDNLRSPGQTRPGAVGSSAQIPEGIRLEYWPESPSRLIESLLLEIPIPPIYLERSSKADSQSPRATTPYNTRQLRFEQVSASQTPSNVQPQSQVLQRPFEATAGKNTNPIRSIVIDAGANTELRYEVFERLNRGSMNLNERELRNCVYRIPSTTSAELEDDSYWRKS